MSKYADIEQIKKTIREEWVKYMPSELDMNISFVLGKIAEVPTIEIVRCKDCEHYYENTCPTLHEWTELDDYCSYGERRESEE